MLLIILCLTLLPLWLVPKEFADETLKQSIQHPTLLAITIISSVAIPFFSNTSFLTIILLTTYLQAIADNYFQVISPLVLLIQLLFVLNYLPINLTQLISYFLIYSLVSLLLARIARERIGMGDIKLLFLLLYALPIEQFALLLFFSSLLAILYSLLSLIKTRSKTATPFVPFIFWGLLLALLFYQ